MKEKALAIKTDELIARSVLYRALALLLRHPAKEHQVLLSKKTFRAWRPAAKQLKADGKSSLANSIEILIHQLEKTKFADWLREHERIFGHVAASTVPSYELEYGEAHSRREPQELADITAFYQAFGLRLASGVNERADHAAVECDFLQFLTFKEAYALGEDGPEKADICRTARLRFLRDHLGRWMPVFTLRLGKQAGKGLHRSIADFAFAFIVDECESLRIQPGPRDLPIRTLETQEEVSCASCPLADSVPGKQG